MKKSILWVIAILIATPMFSQDMNDYYNSIVSGYSIDSVSRTLHELEALGIKESGTEALEKTKQYIVKHYERWGYSDITYDSFDYNGDENHNIIIRKEGTHFPDTYLIIDGHYDTKTGPGVNDNGSGIATIMESARCLADINTEFSILFIHFAAEEVGLKGSRHYVDYVAVPENLDIKLVFNIDEVGGVNGEANTQLTCERDETFPTSNNALSWSYTDTLATLTSLYSDLTPTISYAYGSDYVPFQEEGFVITGFYETNESPFPHTSNDTFDNLDSTYTHQVGRAVCAASLYFSGAWEDNTQISTYNALNRMHIYPNPVVDNLHIELEGNEAHIVKIYALFGTLVMQHQISTAKSSIDASHLAKGLYVIQDEHGNSTRFIKH